MNNPLPPKTSMFWYDNSYTYEEAVQAFESDGTLKSLNIVPTTESDDLAGSPPERSMFWEGETKKIDPPPPSEPEPLNLKTEKEATEASPAHFIPVRYAIDQLETEETQPFGLPEEWKGQGPAKLNTVGYTLRQLRDGWLYVYDAINKSLDEYEIKGTQFTLYKLGESESPKSEQRGTPQDAKPFLTYVNGSVLSICFSEHRWTWHTFMRVLNNPSNHIDRMQTIVLSSNENQHNIAPIDKLTQVADIESSAVDDGRFADSGVATKADEDGSVFKPVAVESDLTSTIPEEESGYLVAIKDYAADIQDMSLHFVGAASPYRLFTDQFSNQWNLMQTAMQLCMFGASDEIDMPASVKRNGEELSFYTDMAEYYDSSSQLDLAEQNKSSVQSGYPAKFSAGAIESHQHTQSDIAKAIQDKYRISASRFGKYEQWIATERWRQQLNWKQMLSEMQELSEQKETMLAQVVSVKRDFIAVMESLTPHHLERTFDLYSEDTQYSLYQLHKQAVESFTLVIQEEDRQWAESQWEKPTSLLALYASGFSRSLFKVMEKNITEALDEQSIVSENPDPDNQLMDQISDTSNRVNMYSKIMDFVSNPNTAETAFLKDIAKGFQELDIIFKSAIGALAKGVVEFGVSMTSQVSISLMPVFAKPLNRHSYYLFAVIAEHMAHNMPVTIKEGYARDFKKWKTRVNDYLIKLEKNDAIIADFQKNNRKADSKYTTALKNKKTIKKALAVATLEYPQYIELPDDLPQRTIELRTRIVMNKLNDLNKLFENAGGLGFLALIFNCIALGDAMSSIQDTGLMSSDEFLDIQQKLFYTVNAWTGVRTGKLWEKVKGEPRLRSHSYNVLKKLVNRNEDTFKNLNLDDLKVFNKWLAITGALGALASGIEAYRSWQSADKVYGQEKYLHVANTLVLTAMSAVGIFQVYGGLTGQFALNLSFGGPITAGLVILTIAYLAINYKLNKLKQDDFQKWLDKLPWGYHPTRTQWSQSSSLPEREKHNSALVQQALFDLQSIIQQPTVYHQPIEKVQAYPGYTHRELIGLEVHIQLPRRAATNGITLRTNSKATEDDLMSGSWHQNADLVTLQTQDQASKESLVYKVTLPIEEADHYLAMQVAYDVEDDAPAKREYWFQNGIKQSATYGIISDNIKQDIIKKTLTPAVGTLGFQE
ncbi:T6SS effector BTH_I2691 family protein [Vibrio sp. Vb0562]|uniref:T6SS effector BTH_I2691 family protein n=1 Tax=Vibrio sp. Vb0562 TaxID=3074625 RepID=UPI0029648AE0|nr:T6SS effector BTH_I2691 family protein [Vibrio sp. Vb0562]MDW1955319.1 T6SS effector BTH_I2691 family protein [Vibrio sp. Vb0562]